MNLVFRYLQDKGILPGHHYTPINWDYLTSVSYCYCDQTYDKFYRQHSKVEVTLEFILRDGNTDCVKGLLELDSTLGILKFQFHDKTMELYNVFMSKYEIDNPVVFVLAPKITITLIADTLKTYQ